MFASAPSPVNDETAAAATRPPPALMKARRAIYSGQTRRAARDTRADLDVQRQDVRRCRCHGTEVLCNPMDETQEKTLRNWHAAYAERFKPDGSLHPHLQLKLEHSQRVAGDAADIARDLGWPEGDVRTAGVLGLLHDVGRFSQFAEFGTFSDRRSIDHGERGFEILVKESPLDMCIGLDRARILDGVRYHNAKHLPDGIEADSQSFAGLVRDADKLDVYRLVHRGIVTGELERDGDFMGGLDREAAPSEEVLECLRQGRTAPNGAVRGLTDYLLLQASWVFDISCFPAMKRLGERRLLENIRENLRIRLPGDAAVAEVLALAADFRDRALGCGR